MTPPIASTRTTVASRLALLWLAVALLFQGFALQTHAHPGADRAWAATGAARVAAVDDRRQAPGLPACPLCEDKALFGAYLLGDAVTIAAPYDATYGPVATTLPSLALRRSATGWRSRAPPILTA